MNLPYSSYLMLMCPANQKFNDRLYPVCCPFSLPCSLKKGSWQKNFFMTVKSFEDIY